jgi:hypothetical protein
MTSRFHSGLLLLGVSIGCASPRAPRVQLPAELPAPRPAQPPPQLPAPRRVQLLPELPATPEDEDASEGGAPGALVIGVGRTHGMRYVERDKPADTLEGQSLLSVKLDRSVLAPGERTRGIARFTPAADFYYRLQANAPPHSWSLWVGNRADGTAELWLGCSRTLPAHVVHWRFFMRGRYGSRSNVIEVPVTCASAAAAP